MKRLLIIIPLLLMTGCSTVNHVALMEAKVNALSSGMEKCGDNAGCQVALTAFIFGGGLDTPQEAGPVQYAAAFLPYANLLLNAYSLTMGGGGSANAMYVKGSNNTFIGWNRTSADRQSSVSADFGVDIANYFNNRYYTQTGADGATTQGDMMR